MTTTTKRLLLTGRLTRHGYSMDIAPRQEVLHKCSGCGREFARSELRVSNGMYKCSYCAPFARDESEEE